MFNIWRPYPLLKPKTDGWYSVSLFDGTVMDLEYISWSNRWMDSRRQSVFNGYKVYKSGRAAIDENRVFDDKLCNRTSEVVAWRKIGLPYCWWWKGNNTSKN